MDKKKTEKEHLEGSADQFWAINQVRCNLEASIEPVDSISVTRSGKKVVVAVFHMYSGEDITYQITSGGYYWEKKA